MGDDVWLIDQTRLIVIVLFSVATALTLVKATASGVDARRTIAFAICPGRNHPTRSHVIASVVARIVGVLIEHFGVALPVVDRIGKPARIRSVERTGKCDFPSTFAASVTVARPAGMAEGRLAMVVMDDATHGLLLL